eukprot:TRINITY_DN30293_c0_g1_i1.p1 TRINITY_DN30293_c0_g1~~TRINITY_DN30293_c0_g1_i1.p1  ORF type:complete len:710 (-),score=146.81 TRINITY_DN30293_c0_g1_i1:65-2194(-)
MPRPPQTEEALAQPALKAAEIDRRFQLQPRVPQTEVLQSDQPALRAAEIDSRFQLHLQGLVDAFKELQQCHELIQAGVGAASSLSKKPGLQTEAVGFVPNLAEGSPLEGQGPTPSSNAARKAMNKASSSLSAMGDEDESILQADLSGKRDALMALFRDIDADGSGIIGIEEMRQALRAIGEHPARARRMLAICDENGNGVIEFEEWKQTVDKLCVGKASFGVAKIARKLVDHHEEHGGRDSVFTNVSITGEQKVPFLILRHCSQRRIVWDLFIASLLAYLAVVMPFNLAFFDGEPGDAFMILSVVVDICFVIDILINFRTTYVGKDGAEVFAPRKIAVNYLQTWFALDFWSSVPLDYVTAGAMPSLEAMKILKSGKVIKVLKVLRALKVFKLVQSSQLANQIEEYVMNSNLHSAFDLATILICCCFFCHLLACFMCISGSGFLEAYAHDEGHVFSRYCSAMYWAVTTATTVGYGDIVPVSDMERVFAMMAMISGATLYGHVVGVLSVIAAHRDITKRRYRERMRNLAAWLTQHKFPKHLRQRLWIFYKSYETSKTGLEQHSILDDLSPQLRQAVVEFLIHPEVRNHMLFHNLPIIALVRLMPILQQITAQADEHITSRGHLGHAMFIIIEGCALMEMEKEMGGLSVETLQVGDSFGEEIVLGLKDHYEYNVMAASSGFSTLFMIRVELFVERFSDLPQIVEQMRRNYAD